MIVFLIPAILLSYLSYTRKVVTKINLEIETKRRLSVGPANFLGDFIVI